MLSEAISVGPLIAFSFFLFWHKSEMLPVLRQIKSWARLRMTLRAPRSKPQMLSKPRSSVSASAEPLEVSPHITNLELAPVFWKTSMSVENQSRNPVVSASKPDMNRRTHPSVLLQSLRWTGRERPQRVVGQNDKHVCCSASLCGPCDRKCAVCAATRHLWTVTAWKKLARENGWVKCGINNQYKARKAKLGFMSFSSLLLHMYVLWPVPMSLLQESCQP